MGILALDCGKETGGQLTFDCRNDDGARTRRARTVDDQGAWWHFLGSTWLIDTNLDAEGIWKRLDTHFDENDRALVIGVTKDYQGWLPKAACEWINDRRARMGA